jgi:hypothetical protein
VVLLEVLLASLLLAAPAFFLALEWRARRRRRHAEWTAVTRGVPEGGWVVELRREGEPPQLVSRIPPGLPHEEFAERLAQAEAEADADAAVLNSRRRTTGGLQRRTQRPLP